MNFLIDTHALIWFITDDKKLPIRTKSLIEDKKNLCYVSIASFWDIGIKYSIGRLDLNSDLTTIFQLIEDSGFEILPLTTNQILQNASLDFHHQDPFDRIIIAQAITENLNIISKDAIFKNYHCSIIWNK